MTESGGDGHHTNPSRVMKNLCVVFLVLIAIVHMFQRAYTIIRLLKAMFFFFFVPTNIGNLLLSSVYFFSALQYINAVTPRQLYS